MNLRRRVPSCTEFFGAGSTLCRSPSVAAVSFTGSTAVGQLLYEQCGVGIKRLALELGGDAAFVVFESADLPLAIQAGLLLVFLLK